jgi:glycosyltransferase involved in cell wall biosynthesis
MIYLLPIEPLKERYSSWWNSYFPQKLKSLNKPFVEITGETLTDTVETGTVLDASSTCFYKAVQLQKICKLFKENKINSYDHFLICDIWFPGIEMIKYMSELYGVNTSVWGIWHCGSCVPRDFTVPMHDWSKYFETGFLNMCDGVFVGSEYSKQTIMQGILYNTLEEEKIASKITTYGMPLNFQYLQKFKDEKENIILFPHRPDLPKNPNIMIDIIYSLSTYWDKFDDFKFVFCTSKKEYKSEDTWINALLGSLKKNFKNVEIYEDLEKEDYYSLLRKSKLVISTSVGETFGYCMVEALAVGTHILAPHDYSYPEIVEEDYTLLYDSIDDLLSKIVKYSEEPSDEKTLKSFVEPYDHVIEKWVEVMGA